jgi:hypothetical protein
MSKKEMDKMHELFAMHYYMTGTAFMRAEEEHLLEALQVLRPDVTIPSGKQ